MGLRHTVFLKHSAAKVTPEQLLAAIQGANLARTAEKWGVPPAMIDEALQNLRIESLRPPGFLFYRLSYHPTQVRHIDVERWRKPIDVTGEVAEILDNLDPENPDSEIIKQHLEKCVDSVSAFYDGMPGEAMAPILASAVCRWLAEKFGGIVRNPLDDWYEPGKWRDVKPL
jgi:hypothetical protein